MEPNLPPPSPGQATKRCASCGDQMWPRAGEGPARFARRVCCSRRCALARPPKAGTVEARAQLTEALRRVPDQVVNGSAQRAQTYLDAYRGAQRAMRRGAGQETCRWWVEQLQKVSNG